MPKKNVISAEQMGQFATELRFAGFTPEDISRLGGNVDLLKKVKSVLNGTAEINIAKITKHVIDCDANPFVLFSNWTVEEHQKQGQLIWDPTKLKLFLSKKQKEGGIRGHELRKELQNKLVLNVNVMDYLLGHPEIIPEEWKGKKIFFWGTIYRHTCDRTAYVRYFYWNGFKWSHDYNLFEVGRLDYNDLAVFLAS